MVERKAASPCPNSALRERCGGWTAFLPAWEEEVANSISGTDLDGRGQRKKLSAPFSCKSRNQQSIVLLKGARGRRLQQDEQAYESRCKFIQLLHVGQEVVPRERCRRWVGTSCKVLECQVPKDPGGDRLKPLFSLTIRLQLVGKLKEEVLVVNDLELAYVSLGLQVMGGCLHIQAWNVRREGIRLPVSLLPLYTYQPEEKGADRSRCWSGGPLGRPRRERITDKFKEINIRTGNSPRNCPA